MSGVENDMLLSLDDYAAARVQPKCGVCALAEPVRHAIEENDRRVKPHPLRVVAAWASEESGKRVTTDMIQKHFYRNH